MKVGKIERQILLFIKEDEEKREKLQFDPNRHMNEENFRVWKAATYEGAIKEHFEKKHEEWAARASSLHPTPASVFKRFVSRMKNVERALESLQKKGLIAVKYVGIKIGEREIILKGYNLTEKARKQLERWERCEAEDVRAALKHLKALHIYRATIKEIKEALWQTTGSKYQNREEFEKIWTKERIGCILKKMGVKKARKKTNQSSLRLYYIME